MIQSNFPKELKPYVFLVLVLTGLIFNFALATPSNVLDFIFFESDQKSFRSVTLRQDLIRQNYDVHSPLILLIQTQSLKDPKFLKQYHLDDSIDAVELELLYVVACPTEVHKDGYYTDMATAKMLNHSGNKFQITLLDDQGQIFYQTSKGLSSKKITSIILKLKNKEKHGNHPNPLRP